MGIVYMHNASPNPPHVFVVDVETGETVGEFNVTTPSPLVVVNPQGIRLDWTNGDLYLADIGDPQGVRTDIGLWRVQEPGPGDHGTLPGEFFPVSYPFGHVDAEALAIHPVSGVQYIITKEATGRLVRLPKPLTGNNLGTNMGKAMPAKVTDACFTLDGRWLLIRAEGVKDTLVYDGSTFTFDGTISTPQVSEGRSITMEPTGKCFLIGSEGQFAPIYRVCLPTKYLPEPPKITMLPGSRLTGDPQTYKLQGFFPNASVTVTLKRPNGSVFQTVILSTNSVGEALGTWTPDTAGNWNISATQTVTGGTFTAARTTKITSPCDAASTVPANWLNLTNWKITLPIPLGNGNSPVEIKQPQLNTYEHGQYFFTVCPDRAVLFRAPVNGATTSNSGFPRSELREMKNNGSQLANWNMGSGRHIMTIVQAITVVPDRGDLDPVVAGQIHDDDDDVTVCRLHRGHIYATSSDSVTAFPPIFPNYPLGTYFKLTMDAGPWGIRYSINDVLKRTVPLPSSTSGMYFKAGCYTQANSSNGSGYGEVRIKSLTIVHQ